MRWARKDVADYANSVAGCAFWAFYVAVAVGLGYLYLR